MKKIILLFLPLLMITITYGQERSKAQNTGSKIGKGVADIIKGMEEGIDNSLTKVNVTSEGKITNYIESGRTAKTIDSTESKVVSIYVICKKKIKSKAILKAFDKNNDEMGRKIIDIDIKEDETTFLNFRFDPKTPLDVAEYFTLELKN